MWLPHFMNQSVGLFVLFSTNLSVVLGCDNRNLFCLGKMINELKFMLFKLIMPAKFLPQVKRYSCENMSLIIKFLKRERTRIRSRTTRRRRRGKTFQINSNHLHWFAACYISNWDMKTYCDEQNTSEHKQIDRKSHSYIRWLDLKKFILVALAIFGCEISSLQYISSRLYWRLIFHLELKKINGKAKWYWHHMSCKLWANATQSILIWVQKVPHFLYVRHLIFRIFGHIHSFR